MVENTMTRSHQSQQFLSHNSPLENVKKILDKTTENSRKKFTQGDISTVKIETSEDAAIKRKIEELKAYEDMVVAHEHKHMLVGGSVASSPSYIYTYGPDGRKYISGGNVSMRVPKAATSEQMIQNLKKVQAAALAPHNPSPQDIQVASMARARQASIENEYKVKRAKEKYQKQQEIADEIKLSKYKHLSKLDQMIQGALDNPIKKIKFDIKMSFEMLI